MAGGAMLVVAAAREELGELDGRVVGVGAVVAAARAARILEQERPEAVIMVGTAGAYPGGPPIGTAIASAKVGMSYGIAALGMGYVPRAPSPVDGDAELLAQINAVHLNVLTVGAITTDVSLADRFGEGWEVEHLEAFGVALACAEAGVRFVAVLGISNEVGADAHVQWLTHRDEAQAAARSAILHLLDR